MQERMIMREISDYYKMLDRAVIIEKTQDESLIDINDIITINMFFSPKDFEEFQFILVGKLGLSRNFDSELQEVSVSSPLGRAVYHKKIGDSSMYKVDDRVFNIEILSKKSKSTFEVLKKVKNRTDK